MFRVRNFMASTTGASSRRTIFHTSFYQSFDHLLHTPRHKRQSPRRVNHVYKLLLLDGRLILRPLHLDCQKPAGLGQAADNVGNAARVGGNIAAVRFSDAGVLVLVAGDAFEAQIVQYLLLDVLFEDGGWISCSPLPVGKGRKLSACRIWLYAQRLIILRDGLVYPHRAFFECSER